MISINLNGCYVGVESQVPYENNALMRVLKSNFTCHNNIYIGFNFATWQVVNPSIINDQAAKTLVFYHQRKRFFTNLKLPYSSPFLQCLHDLCLSHDTSKLYWSKVRFLSDFNRWQGILAEFDSGGIHFSHSYHHRKLNSTLHDLQGSS